MGRADAPGINDVALALDACSQSAFSARPFHRAYALIDKHSLALTGAEHRLALEPVVAHGARMTEWLLPARGDERLRAAVSALWFRGFVGAVVCGIALILGGCGGGSKDHSSVTGSASSTASRTASAPVTSTASGTPAIRTLRCPHSLTLPGPGKYAGQVATVFIVASAPKQSGCTFVTGWMAEWIKAGASPGGYAAGSYIGYRCNEPLLANQGPLGEKYAQYGGVIHCDRIDESAGDPQSQLDGNPAGIWGYYGTASNAGSETTNSPAAEPAIPGSTLSKVLAKQLMTFASLQPDSVTCPALVRKRGAKATCSVSGKAKLDGGSTELHGTADVTIQDQAGHSAEDTYQLTGPGSAGIRGKGYPFDPNTGRVL